MQFNFKCAMFFVVLLFSVLFGSSLYAQISPPGMDDTNAVLWGAAAVSQQIGKSWMVSAYAGIARESDPDNWSLLRKQAIFVINQQTRYLLSKKWQLAFCSSLRKQKIYLDTEPYSVDDPSLRNELRYYLRLYYRTNTGRFNLTYSFRPELRNFYDNKWNHWHSSPEELRIRFKVQATLPLNKERSNQMILANEWLSATDEKRNNNGELHWSSYVFTEDRLSMYWRHVFGTHLIFDLGLMHQLKFADGHVQYIKQLAFDFIYQNPFGIPKAHR